MIPPTAADIDRATIVTWPARVTEERDGWFYLADNGVTGRVNAVWPLGQPGGDIDHAIDAAEAWYAARNLPPRFKLTDGATAPDDLAERLARRGYTQASPTLVMRAQLSADPGAYEGVELAAAPPPAFNQALEASAVSAEDMAERRGIALRAPQPAAFGSRMRDERVVAVGVSVVSARLAGIYLMRTVPDARRQGHALHLLRGLLDWAANRQKAQHAFLQVDTDNTPAISLYLREGFETLTTYRYWKKS
ncbi:MAG: GNAT family N-acetyltransferase [Hyphomonadaceae bacterium]|nr:GNAT family N-acetyltransferase [Hyphomonadaceae bacterium]